MKGDTYSGFTFFGKHLGYSSSEEEFISENIRRILGTRKGERVNEPDFGSNIQSYLFMPQVYVSDLIDEIISCIERQEPRVKVNSCTLQSANQDDVVTIKLELKILSSSNNMTLEVNV